MRLLNFTARPMPADMTPMPANHSRNDLMIASLTSNSLKCLVIVALATLGIASSGAAEPSSVSLRDGDRVIATYHAETQVAPNPDEPWFNRSGFIHPFCTPSGIAVTCDFPIEHEHQHGLMFAWTSSHINGRPVDFWNAAELEARVEHAELLMAEPSVIRAKLRHIELPDDSNGEEKLALDETWQIKRVDHPTMNVMDLVSEQHNVMNVPLTIKEYHYGAMCVRGPNAWMDGKSTITDDRHQDREQGNHSRPKYVVMYGEIDGKPCGLAAISHSGNFRSPQPVRVHPNDPYFCFAPMVLGDFEIEAGSTYTSAFRFAAFDGPPDHEALQALATQFAELPFDQLQIKPLN
ncbi:PmoA family protein [Rubripirellula amarantea]|nr:PmoA family protein [Rubripirellula amarantea]